jgi:hypothetical protein
MGSFLASYKIKPIESFSWLKESLIKIAGQIVNRIDELLLGVVKE